MKIMYFLAATILLSACIRLGDIDGSITGSGTILNETRLVSGFTKISLEGPMDVIVTQGTIEGVRIEGEDNLMKHISTQVTNGELEIWNTESLSPTKPIKVYVTARSLEGLVIAGSGSIMSESQFTSKHFEASIAGSGDIHANVIAESVDASIAGSGDVILKGSAGKTEINVAGSGDVRAFELQSKSATVDIAGSGDCEVTVSEQLTGNIMGSGSIYYKGEPKLNSSIMGSGEIERR